MKSQLNSPSFSGLTLLAVMSILVVLFSCCLHWESAPAKIAIHPPTPPWQPDRRIEQSRDEDAVGAEFAAEVPLQDSHVQRASFETLYEGSDEEGGQIQAVCGWEEPFAKERSAAKLAPTRDQSPEPSALESVEPTDKRNLSQRLKLGQMKTERGTDSWTEEGLYGSMDEPLEADSMDDSQGSGSAASEEWPDTPEEHDEAATADSEPEEMGHAAQDASRLHHELMGPDWYATSVPMSLETEARQARIRQVLDHYYRLPFNAQDDSPWSMIHHILAWAADARNYVGAPGTELVSTIGWICGNAPCERERLLLISNRRLTPRNGPGLQGHEGQLLAMFAQARLSRQQPIRVQGQEFTIEDLINSEQVTCRPNMELTFKLIAFSHYLKPDATWRDTQGQSWDFARLLDEEIGAPIIGAACGGTHRLMGLSCAVRAARRYGLAVEGPWERADKHVQAYQTSAFHLQNADGSFSSDWFRRRGTWGGLERKLKTTGHFTEWLVYSLPNDQLTRPELARAIDFLCTTLGENRFATWPKGPLSHAIRALSLYDERVFGNSPGQRHIQRPELRAPLPPKSIPLPQTAVGNSLPHPQRTSGAPIRSGRTWRGR